MKLDAIQIELEVLNTVSVGLIARRSVLDGDKEWPARFELLAPVQFFAVIPLSRVCLASLCHGPLQCDFQCLTP